VQLNLKNITDEEYNYAQAGTTTDSFGAVRVGTSTPRTVNVSLSVEF
jgi:outer membrane receptor protein involved in Fe transport